MSLGIANSVTRETHGTGTKYHEELAKQLADLLTKPIEVSINQEVGSLFNLCSDQV